jgi:transposase
MLPNHVAAFRALLICCKEEHAAEDETARNGLKEQAFRFEQTKARSAKLLRQRFGSSSEKMKCTIDEFKLIIDDLEENLTETALPETQQEPEPDGIKSDVRARRRKPKRRPLPEDLPRDAAKHAAACARPKCGGALGYPGEDVTELLQYVPVSFHVFRHVRPKTFCRCCEQHHSASGAEPTHQPGPYWSGSDGARAARQILRLSGAIFMPPPVGIACRASL